jgi:hypothetical protein
MKRMSNVSIQHPRVKKSELMKRREDLLRHLFSCLRTLSKKTFPYSAMKSGRKERHKRYLFTNPKFVNYINFIHRVPITSLLQSIKQYIGLPVILYGCETWSLTLKEFENRVMRRTTGPKREEVAEG